MLWRTRFFIMLVQSCTKSLRKRGIQNIFLQEFPILLALNFYAFMCTYDFYRYEKVYTYRKKGFQNILESKKIMQLA